MIETGDASILDGTHEYMIAMQIGGFLVTRST